MEDKLYGTSPVEIQIQVPSDLLKNGAPTALRLEWVREQIETLDLDPIKIKLMDAEEGAGWSRSQADETDLMYRRFLYLTAKYPSLSIVPSKTVDTMWHAHILDTRKYAQDCERIFGHFLHHFPYFGMRDEQDARELVQAFAESKRLYVAEFGQQPTTAKAKCSSEDDDPRLPPYCDAWDDAHPVRPALQDKTSRVPLYNS